MAEAKGYDHDIFISYAHVDNPPLAGSQGWVTSFHNDLEGALKARGLADIAIWRDERHIRGNTLFNAEIKNSLEQTAMILVVISTNLLNSNYCQHELSTFCDAHSGFGQNVQGLTLGSLSRILPVRIQNIAFDEWPQQAQGLPGYNMFDTPQGDVLGYPLPYTDHRYVIRLHQIAADIHNAVRAANATYKTAAPKRSFVFVADTDETETSMRDFREHLIVKIKETKLVDVLPGPDSPLPKDASAHELAVQECLKKAALCIHMLNQHPGRKMDGQEGTTYPRRQYELAVLNGKPQIIWMPQELDIVTMPDNDQRAFLAKCIEHPRINIKQYQVVHSPQTVLLKTVEARIAELIRPPHGARYLINTHQTDQEFGFMLGLALRRQNETVDFIHESQNPTDSLTNFEKSVSRARNLVLVYGKVGTNWLIGRIKKALTTIAMQLDIDCQETLQKIWVFSAPPNEGPPILPFPPCVNIDILVNRGNSDIDTPVIEKLLSAGAG